MSQQEEQQSTSLGAPANVQDFRERYPYPRPIDGLEKYQRLWQDPLRRRADYHLCWPARPYREDHSILIVGCGTSPAAMHALRWPAAQVTGIDFSATSVRCTDELKRKDDLTNLRVYQLPIERAADLETSFDQIVCTRVLHHLADPDAGLSALRGVLKPYGAMRLMDSREKRLFDALDGKRSIGDIVERGLSSADKVSRRGIARGFFERPWWYDQVVFAAAPAGCEERQ